MEIVWVVVLIMSVVAYGVLMAYVLPRSFLKTEFATSESFDRGVKNIKETVGRSIVYQPSLKYRKYVPQYVISERKGKKVLICKLAPNVKYIDYDVVAFNGVNKVCNVVNVKEVVEKGYTEKLLLNEDVAYISLVINAVNDEEFDNKTLKPVSGGKIAAYTLSCAGLTLLEIFLTKLCCSYGFGGVFRESFMVNLQSTVITITFALVAIVVNVSFILSVVLKGSRNKADKGE